MTHKEDDGTAESQINSPIPITGVRKQSGHQASFTTNQSRSGMCSYTPTNSY